MDCGDKINLFGSFLRWHKMYFCNRSCAIVYLMDKGRECFECKSKIQTDLLGNRTRRIGDGNCISFFCSVDCITRYNLNLPNQFYDNDGFSSLDTEKFHDIWNNIFKNGELSLLNYLFIISQSVLRFHLGHRVHFPFN